MLGRTKSPSNVRICQRTWSMWYNHLNATPPSKLDGSAPTGWSRKPQLRVMALWQGKFWSKEVWRSLVTSMPRRWRLAPPCSWYLCKELVHPLQTLVPKEGRSSYILSLQSVRMMLEGDIGKRQKTKTSCSEQPSLCRLSIAPSLCRLQCVASIRFCFWWDSQGRNSCLMPMILFLCVCLAHQEVAQLAQEACRCLRWSPWPTWMGLQSLFLMHWCSRIAMEENGWSSDPVHLLFPNWCWATCPNSDNWKIQVWQHHHNYASSKRKSETVFCTLSTVLVRTCLVSQNQILKQATSSKTRSALLRMHLTLWRSSWAALRWSSRSPVVGRKLI